MRMRIATLSLAAGAALASYGVSADAATITSSNFTFAFGVTVQTTTGNSWTQDSNTNSPPTQGNFTFSPAPLGQFQSRNGPKFFERVLYQGDPGDVDTVGALSDPWGASGGGFSLPISASYNGPAPVDAAPTPNYRLRIELTNVSIWGATTQAVNNTLAWDEITPGHAQTSGSINLTLANNETLLDAPSSYTQLVWDPSDYDETIGGLNSTFTRTMDFLVGTGNDGKIGDGIQVDGRVVLVYDAIPEPASLGLFGLAGAALLGRRRM